ncbi:MAG: hypothetical protein D3906_06425 [Candidatus Electrothrix sp. AUS1_2]|nr:hypothetical protein [Candidatus Electrothrix sp. AUS1_2]
MSGLKTPRFPSALLMMNLCPLLRRKGEGMILPRNLRIQRNPPRRHLLCSPFLYLNDRISRKRTIPRKYRDKKQLRSRKLLPR